MRGIKTRKSAFKVCWFSKLLVSQRAQVDKLVVDTVITQVYACAKEEIVQ